MLLIDAQVASPSPQAMYINPMQMPLRNKTVSIIREYRVSNPPAPQKITHRPFLRNRIAAPYKERSSSHGFPSSSPQTSARGVARLVPAPPPKQSPHCRLMSLSESAGVPYSPNFSFSLRAHGTAKERLGPQKMEKGRKNFACTPDLP